MQASVETPVAVAVIIYKRPEHTRKLLTQVNSSQPRRLYVIADGPKASIEETKLTEATRAVVDSFSWTCEVIKIYAHHNLGLRRRVLSGLDAVFEAEESAIILEDDCYPSPTFFEFARLGLEKFRHDPTVSLIAGSSPLLPRKMPSVYLTMDSPIWGWATWSRTWNQFRAESTGPQWSMSELERIASSFENPLYRRRFMGMLKKSHRLDSWAVEFAAFNRLKGKTALVSSINLVENIGFGPDSTHTKFESFVDQPTFGHLPSGFALPKVIKFQRNLERRIQRHRYKVWLRYPLIHPYDFARRIWRFLKSV